MRRSPLGSEDKVVLSPVASRKGKAEMRSNRWFVLIFCCLGIPEICCGQRPDMEPSRATAPFAASQTRPGMPLFLSQQEEQRQQLPEIVVMPPQAEAADGDAGVIAGPPYFGAPSQQTPVGPYGQPEWTTRRRFATTRVYVRPPGQIEFEQWWRPKWPRDGKPEHLFEEEISVGLPYRFQLDLYQDFEDTPETPFRANESKVELRWALADWGDLPLNPTLYFEQKFVDESNPASGDDVTEFKLLFAENLDPCWDWASNVIFEWEHGGAREREYAISQAISRSLIDKELSVGMEMVLEWTTEAGSRSDPALEFLIGPSLQWRPTPRTHLDVVPLFGTTGDSPLVEAFVVFGVDLTPGQALAEAPVSAPSATRGR